MHHEIRGYSTLTRYYDNQEVEYAVEFDAIFDIALHMWKIYDVKIINVIHEKKEPPRGIFAIGMAIEYLSIKELQHLEGIADYYFEKSIEISKNQQENACIIGWLGK